MQYAIGQSASGDTISVAAGTYNEHVVVDRSLTIRGTGAGLTYIDGTSGSSVVSIMGSSLTVTLRGMTVEKGAAVAGGGIYVSSGNTATVTQSTVSGNSASGSEAGSGQGGGIYNAGILSVVDSTVSGNSAVGGKPGGGGQGGGIYNVGRLSLVRSTISGNSALGGKGGPCCGLWGTVRGGTGAGGGLYDAASTGSAILANSTVFGNIAQGGDGGVSWGGIGGSGGDGRGGGIESAGVDSVLNTTIAGNRTYGGQPGCSPHSCGSAGTTYGGGIDVAGSVTATNSILATNAAANGPSCFGTVTSNGHNVLASSSSCAGLTGAGDLVNVDPLLGPLQKNGGPTSTMALGTGSPAIDSADDAVCAAVPVRGVDQRGFRRPGGQHCDIGSFEVQP